MANREIIEKNYGYFINNHKILVKQYLDKFLIIKDEKVQKAFDVE